MPLGRKARASHRNCTNIVQDQKEWENPNFSSSQHKNRCRKQKYKEIATKMCKISKNISQTFLQICQVEWLFGLRLDVTVPKTFLSWIWIQTIPRGRGTQRHPVGTTEYFLAKIFLCESEIFLVKNIAFLSSFPFNRFLH